MIEPNLSRITLGNRVGRKQADPAFDLNEAGGKQEEVRDKIGTTLATLSQVMDEVFPRRVAVRWGNPSSP